VKHGKRTLECLHLINEGAADNATKDDLRRWRLELNLDQRALAQTLGVSQCTVSRAEAHGKRSTSYARMVWLLWYGMEQQQLIATLRIALGERVVAQGPRLGTAD